MVFDVINFDWLMKNLDSNQFLIAGIFGAVAYVARSIPSRIYEFSRKALTIEFVITNEDNIYQDTLDYIEDIHISWLNRSYSRVNNMNHNNTRVFEDESTKKKTFQNLTVGYGRSWFRYKGKVCTVFRSFKESNHSQVLKEELKIVMFTRNKQILVDFINDVTKIEDMDYVQIYTPSTYGDWQREVKIHKRALDSVYIDFELKRKILNRIDSFIQNRENYYNKGIPYKLGLMISGKPGTGKTSLIKALASHYSRDIYLVNKNILKESPEIGHIDFRKSILVFEDIDSFNVVKDRDADEDGKMSMSMLLQILDGALTPDGLMVFATTNDIKSIDSAIIRKGRFDEIIEINELGYETFIVMCSRLWDIDIDTVRQTVSETDYKYPLVGSQLQDLYLVCGDYNNIKGELYDKVSRGITTS